jgi:hypothetical protein
MDSSVKLTVRFLETQQYDINEDCEVADFMAITGRGSYWARLVIDNPKDLSTGRKRFRERTLEAMQRGIVPSEVDLG